MAHPVFLFGISTPQESFSPQPWKGTRWELDEPLRFEIWGKQERRKVSNRKSMICPWSLVLLGVGQQFQLWSFHRWSQGLGVSRIGCRHDLETDIVRSCSTYQSKYGILQYTWLKPQHHRVNEGLDMGRKLTQKQGLGCRGIVSQLQINLICIVYTR